MADDPLLPLAAAAVNAAAAVRISAAGGAAGGPPPPPPPHPQPQQPQGSQQPQPPAGSREPQQPQPGQERQPENAGANAAAAPAADEADPGDTSSDFSEDDLEDSASEPDGEAAADPAEPTPPPPAAATAANVSVFEAEFMVESIPPEGVLYGPWEERLAGGLRWRLVLGLKPHNRQAGVFLQCAFPGQKLRDSGVVVPPLPADAGTQGGTDSAMVGDGGGGASSKAAPGSGQLPELLPAKYTRSMFSGPGSLRFVRASSNFHLYSRSLEAPPAPDPVTSTAAPGDSSGPIPAPAPAPAETLKNSSVAAQVDSVIAAASAIAAAAAPHSVAAAAVAPPPAQPAGPGDGWVARGTRTLTNGAWEPGGADHGFWFSFSLPLGTNGSQPSEPARPRRTNIRARVELYLQPAWLAQAQKEATSERQGGFNSFAPTTAGTTGLRAANSSSASGFAGIVNQGATCYMNSYLQTLYNLPVFRHAVFDMPTGPECEEHMQRLQAPDFQQPLQPSVPLALQQLFVMMQQSREAVVTKQLTRAFGWVTEEVLEQRDVQEFSRVLSDALERYMKGTPVEGTIQRLFEGRSENYRECTQVDFRSSSREAFHDLSVPVKHKRGLLESLRDYVKPELLTGNNKYRAEHFGLQEAKMGIRFLRFPPVLQIQLKRFDFDERFLTMAKVDSRFEFPTTLDVSEFLEHQDMPEADALDPERHLYILHTILVHSGSINGGHYYSFIRPFLETRSGRPYAGNAWYRFDDDSVRRVTSHEAVDQNFGGPASLGQAYILVYVRKSWTEFPTPERAVRALDAEIRALQEQEREQERQRKLKAEAECQTELGQPPPSSASSAASSAAPASSSPAAAAMASPSAKPSDSDGDVQMSSVASAVQLAASAASASAPAAASQPRPDAHLLVLRELRAWRRERHRRRLAEARAQGKPLQLSGSALERERERQLRMALEGLAKEPLPANLSRFFLKRDHWSRRRKAFELDSRAPARQLLLPAPPAVARLLAEQTNREVRRRAEELDRASRVSLQLWLELPPPLPAGASASAIRELVGERRRRLERDWDWWAPPAWSVRHRPDPGAEAQACGVPHPLEVATRRFDWPCTAGPGSLQPFRAPLADYRRDPELPEVYPRQHEDRRLMRLAALKACAPFWAGFRRIPPNPDDEGDLQTLVSGQEIVCGLPAPDLVLAGIPTPTAAAPGAPRPGLGLGDARALVERLLGVPGLEVFGVDFAPPPREIAGLQPQPLFLDQQQPWEFAGSFPEDPPPAASGGLRLLPLTDASQPLPNGVRLWVRRADSELRALLRLRAYLRLLRGRADQLQPQPTGLPQQQQQLSIPEFAEFWPPELLGSLPDATHSAAALLEGPGDPTHTSQESGSRGDVPLQRPSVTEAAVAVGQKRKLDHIHDGAAPKGPESAGSPSPASSLDTEAAQEQPRKRLRPAPGSDAAAAAPSASQAPLWLGSFVSELQQVQALLRPDPAPGLGPDAGAGGEDVWQQAVAAGSQLVEDAESAQIRQDFAQQQQAEGGSRGVIKQIGGLLSSVAGLLLPNGGGRNNTSVHGPGLGFAGSIMGDDIDDDASEWDLGTHMVDDSGSHLETGGAAAAAAALEDAVVWLKFWDSRAQSLQLVGSLSFRGAAGRTLGWLLELLGDPAELYLERPAFREDALRAKEGQLGGWRSASLPQQQATLESVSGGCLSALLPSAWSPQATLAQLGVCAGASLLICGPPAPQPPSAEDTSADADADSGAPAERRDAGVAAALRPYYRNPTDWLLRLGDRSRVVAVPEHHMEMLRSCLWVSNRLSEPLAVWEKRLADSVEATGSAGATGTLPELPEVPEAVRVFRRALTWTVDRRESSPELLCDQLIAAHPAVRELSGGKPRRLQLCLWPTEVQSERGKPAGLHSYMAYADDTAPLEDLLPASPLVRWLCGRQRQAGLLDAADHFVPPSLRSGRPRMPLLVLPPLRSHSAILVGYRILDHHTSPCLQREDLPQDRPVILHLSAVLDPGFKTEFRFIQPLKFYPGEDDDDPPKLESGEVIRAVRLRLKRLVPQTERECAAWDRWADAQADLPEESRLLLPERPSQLLHIPECISPFGWSSSKHSGIPYRAQGSNYAWKIAVLQQFRRVSKPGFRFFTWSDELADLVRECPSVDEAPELTLPQVEQASRRAQWLRQQVSRVQNLAERDKVRANLAVLCPNGGFTVMTTSARATDDAAAASKADGQAGSLEEHKVSTAEGSASLATAAAATPGSPSAETIEVQLISLILYQVNKKLVSGSSRQGPGPAARTEQFAGEIVSHARPWVIRRGMTVRQLKQQVLERCPLDEILQPGEAAEPKNLFVSVVEVAKDSSDLRREYLLDDDTDLSASRYGIWSKHVHFLGMRFASVRSDRPETRRQPVKDRSFKIR